MILIKKFYLVLAIVMLATIALPVFAVQGDLVIGNQLVLRLRAPAPNGMSIQERIDTVTARVNLLLGYDEFLPNLVSVQLVGNDATISYDGRLIVTVDPLTARDNFSTVEGLAEIWAENLKNAIPEFKAVHPEAPSL